MERAKKEKLRRKAKKAKRRDLEKAMLAKRKRKGKG